MKTIKIFGLPSHQTTERTSGVDFARVIQPMSHLDGYETDGYKFKVDLYDIFKQKETDWKNVSRDYDLVFFNYTVIDWAYAAMGSFVHGKGKKMIIDLDDALWHVNPDNIAYDSLKRVNAGFIITQILRDVDGVTTTNLYLKNLIHAKTNVSYDKMLTVPNSIDFKYYKYKSPPKDKHDILLFHFGSTSHFHDLSEPNFVEGINRIFRDYPNVNFKAIGANIPKLKLKWGERYSYGWGHSDVYKWISEKFPVYMDEADIVVVPLEDNVYNRCKSDIKFLESSTAMKPGVYSDIRPYRETIEDGVNGFIAGTAEKWYESLSILIDSVEKRKEIGTNAYNYVKKERQIQQLVPKYAEFIIKILTNG